MKKLVLCNGRHDMPANDGFVFDTVTDVTDVASLEKQALDRLAELGLSDTRIDLIVTGLTVALIATLNACKLRNIDVVLWHFNRDTSSYFPQVVV